MKNWAILGLCAIPLTCASVVGSLAQTDDLARIVKSGVCPDDLTPYDTVKYSVHCAGMDENSCQLNDKACFEDEKKCWDDVNLMNKQIFSYNNFVRTCAAHK
jgi:hypothetical protein